MSFDKEIASLVLQNRNPSLVEVLLKLSLIAKDMETIQHLVFLRHTHTMTMEILFLQCQDIFSNQVGMNQSAIRQDQIQLLLLAFIMSFPVLFMVRLAILK